jgi:hypothetical protein
MGRQAVRICFFFPRVDFDAAIRSHMVDEEALTWDCVIACVGLECNRQIWDHPAIQVSSIPHTCSLLPLGLLFILPASAANFFSKITTWHFAPIIPSN